MTETTKRILELMEQHGDTAYSLERNAGLPISTVTKWKKNAFKPSADLIVKIAQYYNVSTDYLLCLTNNPSPTKHTNYTEQQNVFVSTNLNELINKKSFVNIAKMYNALPTNKRKLIYRVVKDIVIGLGFDINKILGE